jgi:uncharacterized membrane-anchored protein YhcB (DUF1043 family)
VHTHFGTTARLFNQLTDNYREVYKHLYEAATELCPYYISAQLMLTDNTKPLLSKEERQAAALTASDEVATPPLDYAARSDEQAAPRPLSDEEYGLKE